MSEPLYKVIEDAEPIRPIEKGSKEWYLYHHPNNPKPLGSVITLSVFLIFIKGGILGVIVLWICYAVWCQNNNTRLDNDPYIQKLRKEYRRKRLPVECTEYCKKHFPNLVPGTPEYESAQKHAYEVIMRNYYKD